VLYNNIEKLVGSRNLLLFLLEPALLNRGGLTGRGLALDLNFLGLVGVQFIGEAGFFGRLGGNRSAELLDVGLSIARLDGRRLVGTELAEVEFLDRVGCRKLEFVHVSRAPQLRRIDTLQSMDQKSRYQDYIPWRTAEVRKVRRATEGTCCRETRAKRERCERG
jgi:hypothetical protein